MKFQVVLAAVAAIAVATPAAANEFRAEARAGMSFGDNQSDEFVAGVAAGYDFGEEAFIGAEVSADKLFVDNSGVVLGATVRLGVRDGGNRYYVNAGYTDLTCDFCGDGPHAGAGVELGLTEKVYGKLEYRHFFFEGTDSNVVAVGAGVRF